MAKKIGYETLHPGPYIRANVLPKDISVKKAAEILNVGRPALSNLLNGKAALSSDMAARIERAFGASARELMDMQTTFDADVATDKGAAATAKSYVPPFLQLKANDIEGWADSISARSRFAVFLRTLVNSTGLKLERVEFPGNDDSERPGWDGFVEAGEATPWIPLGKSGWEFGVNQKPKEKADQDYAKSIRQVPDEIERANTTFVFVTPRRWPGKGAWETQRRAEKIWKDIRVFDASNLEEWLEQSIQAQAWLANELGLPSDGVISLDACWNKWVANCDPHPVQALFDPVVEGAKLAAKGKFSKSPNQPLVILADSIIEALAFLHCLFSPDDPYLSMLRDQVAVFTTPGTLTKLASKSARFIAVIADRDTEKELAEQIQNLRSIIIYPRNVTNVDPDIVLEPLNAIDFDKGLQAMGCSRDDIQRLSRESGRSLTVLRRKLSNLAAIRTPSWAADHQAAMPLIPFLFAGAWKANNEADQTVMELLSNNLSYADLERNIASLHQLEDSPVWSVGVFRGLVSKIDVLFAINNKIVGDDIQRFLNVAKLVLSEKDPSLDIPEDQRGTARFYGKVREISKALRDGISETLVLLSVHGNSLLRERIGIDLEIEVGRLIKGLLTPLTTHTLEEHSDDLPMYAEAAPKTFLEILESDLDSDDPQSLGLMRPASTGLFVRCPRTGLLWALETLSWSPEYLARTVLILGRFAQRVINDNWDNKPSKSLSAIFRFWIPQTAATLEKRIETFDLLAEKFPIVAWNICIEQIPDDSQTGRYSHKPRWRTDGHGYGEAVSSEEAYKFSRYALDKAIGWKAHDRQTLGDLVGCISRLSEADQDAIWNLVEEWRKSASEDDKSRLREKIRISTLTRRALKQGTHGGSTDNNLERARQAYDSLLPSDIILKHGWLFRNQWIEESADELESEDIDFDKRDERITVRREIALREILETHGMDGVLRLAEMGQASTVIGRLLPRIFESVDELVEGIRFILDQGPLAESISRQSIIFGALASLRQDQLETALAYLTERLGASEMAPIFSLCPFNSTTLKLLNSLDTEVKDCYWHDVHPHPGWLHTSSQEEIQFAVDRLLEAGRPRAAFHLVHCDMEKIQPKQLFRLMRMIATNNVESSGMYKLEQYSARSAFKELNKSGEIAIEDMAELEFLYIDVLAYDDGGIPNLEQQIEIHPDLYAQLVALVYERDDGGEDPIELQASDSSHNERRATVAYKILESLARIPGHNRFGELDAEEIEKWVGQVRNICKELARDEVCDLSLGKLFSKAPFDSDGVWPCKPVRDALEKIATEALSEGLRTGLYNARGVHWRGDGGGQERELAEKYRNWAQALEFTHPRVFRILMKMVGIYEREANQEDTKANVRRRLY
jgi:addiction module HigA family antidote